MATRGRPKKPATYAEALEADKQIKDAAAVISNVRSKTCDARSTLYTTQYHLRAVFDQRDLIAAAWEDLEDEDANGRMNYLMDQTMQQMAELSRQLAANFDALKEAEEELDQAYRVRSKRCQELSDAYTKQCD